MKKFLLPLFIFTVVFGFGSFFSNSRVRAADWGPSAPGYYNSVTVSPSTTVTAGTTLTVSGNIYGSVTLETDCPINPTTHAQGVAILEDPVTSAFYSLDAGASTNFSATQTQRGQGSRGCIYPSSPQPTINQYIYSFSVNINTTGLATGSHSVVFSGTTSGGLSNDVISPYTVSFTVQAPTPVLSADSDSVYTDNLAKDTLRITNGAGSSDAHLWYHAPTDSAGVFHDSGSMCSTDGSGACSNTYGPWQNNSAGSWQFYATVAGKQSNTISITFKPITSLVPNPLNFIFSGDQVISFKKGGQQIAAPEWVSNSPPVAVPSYAVNLGAKISNIRCSAITLDGNQWLYDSAVNCNAALGGVTLSAGDSKNFNVQITDPPHNSSQNLPPNTYNGYITITANGDFAFLEKNFPRDEGWAIIRGANAASSTASGTISVQYQVPLPAPACSASPNPIIAGQSTTLSAAGGDGANYSWNTGGGSPASGGGVNLPVSYSTTGTKTVTVTNPTDGQTGTCGVTVNAPAAPTGLTASPSCNGPGAQVALNWTGSTGATSYKIYRNGVNIGTTGATSFTDGTAAVNTSYSYTVSAVAGSSESVQSSPAVSATTPPVCPPPTPTLSVSVSANPSSGPSPLSSTLSALVSGTATGTINYSFWWNCSSASTDVATVSGACGSLPAPAGGSCALNGAGYKCNGVNANPQSTSANPYSPAGTYTAKVIAERGTAPSAESRTTIIVSPPLNNAPVVSNVRYIEPNYCTSGPEVTIKWDYSDPDNDPQASYHVEIDDTGSAWNSPFTADSTSLSGTSGEWSTGPNVLQFDTTYKARVQVTDARGATSNWVETSVPSNTWKTPKHAYPLVNFSFSAPKKNLPTQFTDGSTCYNNGNGQTACNNWNWVFGDGSPNSGQQNPSHTYTTINNFTATETVTDNIGGNNVSCSLSAPINIQQAAPAWKEVSPK